MSPLEQTNLIIWACPHCRTRLSIPGSKGASSAAQAGPGQVYARCSECRGLASVELSSGLASGIGAPATGVAASLSPPLPPPPTLDLDAAIDEPLSLDCQAYEHPPTPAPPARTRPGASRIPFALAGTGALALLAGAGNLLRSLSIPQNLPATTPIVSDTLRSAAMAPRAPQPESALKPEPKPELTRARPSANDGDSVLYVQARKEIRTLELRSGPGTEFALVGLAPRDERYPVLQWKAHWFQVQLEETPGLTAWVARDKIDLYSEDFPDDPSGAGPLEPRHKL